MPYQYKKTSTQHAIKAVEITCHSQQQQDIMTYLERRVLQRNRDAVDDKEILGKYRKVFDEEQEQELCEHIVNMKQRFYGITQNDLRCMAYSLARKNNISHTFNNEKKMAGKNWVAG
ncbi:hypothetical protein JTB14_000152 [Gonioctena quinquepunctata]|nr:hypothetical protein JTB14_000152 [Gonioctena quinquepunctata]